MPETFMCELCGELRHDSNIRQITIEIFLCTDCCGSLEAHGDAHRDSNEGIVIHESALIQMLNKNLDRIATLNRHGNHIREELRKLWATPRQ